MEDVPQGQASQRVLTYLTLLFFFFFSLILNKGIVTGFELLFTYQIPGWRQGSVWG